MKGVNGIDVIWEHTGIGENGLDSLIIKTGHDQKTVNIAEKEALFLYEKLLKPIRKFQYMS